MLISETYVNATEGYQLGDSGEYEPFTQNIGELFRSCQKQFGKCISKLFIGEGRQMGWVFQKLTQYEDCKEKYLQETWVSLLERASETKTESFPLIIG